MNDYYKNVLKEIEEIPKDKLGDYLNNLKEQVVLNNKSTRIYFISIPIIFISYFLVQYHGENILKIGPFEFKDRVFIFNFIPLIISYLVGSASSNFYTLITNKFYLSILGKRYFELKEITSLLTIVLPLQGITTQNKFKSKKSNGSCLMLFPVIIFIILGVLLIPAIYYFVIQSICKNFNSINENRLFEYWIPSLLSILLLWYGITNLIKILKFVKMISSIGDYENN